MQCPLIKFATPDDDVVEAATAKHAIIGGCETVTKVIKRHILSLLPKTTEPIPWIMEFAQKSGIQPPDVVYSTTVVDGVAWFECVVHFMDMECDTTAVKQASAKRDAFVAMKQAIEDQFNSILLSMTWS